MAAAPAGRGGQRAGGAAGRANGAAGIKGASGINGALPLLPTEAETRQRLLRTVKKEVGAGGTTDGAQKAPGGHSPAAGRGPPGAGLGRALPWSWGELRALWGR